MTFSDEEDGLSLQSLDILHCLSIDDGGILFQPCPCCTMSDET